MKFLRSIRRYFRDAGRSVIRNFSLSLASISCITITLVVVAISLVLSYNVEHISKNVKSNMTILVFLDEKFDVEKDQKDLEKQISAIENIGPKNFKYVPKKDYVKPMKEEEADISLILDAYTDETLPLLDSYEIKVKDINKMADTAAKLKKISLVSRVNYGEKVVKSVITIFSVIEKICIGGVIALILVTAFLITNTIKLAIFSRKTEIEIMRLVGASNSAIKTPFVIEGSFIGIFGSIIPIILMSYGYSSLYKFLDGELFTPAFGKLVSPYPFIIYSSAILLAIGLLVGMLGSQSAVKKYLKI